MNEDKLRYFLKRVTANLHETRQRLAEAQAAAGEPIAIVAMGCRFPGGVRGPQDLWDLVAGGVDAIGDFPADRGWDADLYDPDPDRVGSSYTRSAGFVHEATDFDPGFFGISPREALAMDPQQRLLLEVSWETLERAGIAPTSLHGSKTGVFIGGSLSGYGFGSSLPGLPDEVEGHLSTGTAGSIMSGRLSYFLGLQGPAVTVDTACSSALVALHLACQSLRSGESALALAGGTTVMSTPAVFVWASRQRGLAADGRSKAFGAAADGMGMGEGAGMVLLERLSDARRNGHEVLAVIRGSAINQDGTSNGLTAPSGPAQQQVILAALAAAGLSGDDVDVVEAHGSGTALGDPIEARALLATYGRNRPEDRPLWLGSVKSNIGHTQSAAGVAGVIKMVLALRNGVLPRTLHAEEPSPHVDWTAGNVRLLSEPVAWPAADRLRRAGVSSFGMSGTNAHLILEEPSAEQEALSPESEADPAGQAELSADAESEAFVASEPEALVASAPEAPALEAPAEPLVTGVTPWVLSARSQAALQAQAGRLREALAARPDLDPADVAWSLATTRSLFEHRAVILGVEPEALPAGVSALADGVAMPSVLSGVAGDVGKTVFVFPGQGAQWVGMGRELLVSCPAFAARMAECAAALAPLVSWSLLDVVNGADGAPSLDAAEVVQPVLWAVMVSLAAIWEAAGVTPDAVVGHSQGEIAAATVAGALSLADAARVVVVRSRALSGLNTAGAMVSVVMGEERIRALMEPWGERLSVAAVNGPAATVVSGEPEAVTEFEAELAAQRMMRWRVPQTDFVAHSAGVQTLESALATDLADVVPGESRVPFFSTALSRWVPGNELDAGYWFANVRNTVRFADAIRDLANEGFYTFIEVSPHPTLEASVADVFEETGIAVVPVVSGTTHQDFSGAVQILSVMGRAFARGVPVDWAKVLGTGQTVDLPTYAFQRQRYWPSGSVGGVDGVVGSAGGADDEFWDAVENGDVRTLADTLAVDGARPFHEIVPALAAWRRGARERSVTGGWRYRLIWSPIADPDPAALSGAWLVVAAPGDGPLAEAVATALTGRGAQAVVIEGGVDRETLAERIGLARTEAGVPVSGVVSLLALDEAPLADQPEVAGGLAGTLTLVQALGDIGVEAPLWPVTRGATGAGEALANPVQAQVWGLGRAVAIEHPDRWGGLVDLPAGPALPDDRTLTRLCAVLAAGDEDQVAIRGTGILARRLVHAPQPRTDRTDRTDRSARPWSPRGSVLITGGTGALAGHVAGLLAERGAARLVLTARSGPTAAGVAGLAARLADQGSTIDVFACDAARRDALAGVLGRIAADGPALSTVLHTAGILDDGLLAGLDAARLASVLSAKAAGAAHLHELTADQDLEDFVLFSSSAAVFGGAGQGNYAAANAYLDALAEHRAARGLPALSVAWGPWDGGGVAGANDAVRQRMRRGLLPEMDAALAVKALDAALAGTDPVLAVMDIDWDQFVAAPGAAQLSVVRDLPEIAERAAAAAAAGPAGAGLAEGELAGRLAGLSRADQDRTLTELICAETAAVLGHTRADAVDAGRAFSDLGLDSLTTLETRQRLSALTGLRLSATLLFDYPTPAALAAYLRGELVGAEQEPADAPAGGTALPAPIDDDPIAVVAMSCRYPGEIRSPEDLWQLVASGGDGISALPVDRGWNADDLYDPDPDREGTTYARAGGFLHDAGDFDAAFFGISPREALAMDPQQRLLLETSWETLERAGLDPRSLRGSKTGVFVGGYSSGYGIQLALQGGLSELEGHLSTGNATSVLSGRLSYVLGLEGPAVTVDTACSSSLVCLHLASQALRNGECSLALVGGITVMATPGEFVSFSRQRGLAPDGRSKAFSAAADGMGMAEGVGMVAVERLSDARRNGHPVLAVIRGSAINQDGSSNGLTAPNGPSQQRVIRAALAASGLKPSEVDVVEAHGTGTELGDPIEAGALMAVYGQDRPADQPLWLGSVKSNIGHTQAAAGVAGIIKMVQALRHEELPRSRYAQDPSPHIDWDAGNVRLLSESVSWPVSGRPRRAGVSSFGISGTNAHVILEEPPVAEGSADGVADPVGAAGPAAGADSVSAAGLAAGPDSAGAVGLVAGAGSVVGGVVPWIVSGRSDAALCSQAERLRASTVARPDLDVRDVAWSLAATRSAFEQRAVVVAQGRQELAAGLAAVATSQAAGSVVTGSASATGRSVFVFPGQGAQWAGMGRELAAASPVFAERLAECGRALAPFVDWSLDDVLADSAALEAVDVVQPALWAVMVSLAAVWQAAGVVPDAVVGHSQGEIAAATVAGALSLDDGARVVALRSRALRVLAGAGGMVSVAEPVDAVRARIAGFGDRLSIAVVNGPSATVVSGEPDALTELLAACEADEVRARRIPVDYASHSAQVEQLREEITAALAPVTPGQLTIPMVSAVSGEWLQGPELDAGYWFDSLRATVEFDRAVRALADSGHSVFLEMSPHPVLTAAVTETLEDQGVAAPVVSGSLRRDNGSPERLLLSFAEAWVRGVDLAWPAVIGAAERVDLPTYAFQHEHYWPEGASVFLPSVRFGTAGSDTATGTAAEAEFWAAIEGGDLDTFADTLALEARDGLGDVLPALASWRRRERDRSATDAWRYRVSWVPVPEPKTVQLSGVWLVLRPSEGADPAAVLGEALSARGAKTVTLAVGSGAADRAALAERLAAASRDQDAPFAGILSLLALDETPLVADSTVTNGLANTQTLVQALGDAELGAPLWVLTAGAVAAAPGEAPASPVQAQVWGLGRAVALEHPDRWGGLVDLPSATEVDERSAARLCAVLAGCGEDQVALRAAGLRARRLVRAGRPRERGRAWSPRGSVLITGGTGAVGGHLARWVTERAAQRTVLASRSGPGADGVARLAAELAAAGTTATVVAGDLADRNAATELVSWIGRSGPRLTAVLHAAGAAQSTAVEATTSAELAEVLAAKAAGAAHLDAATAGEDLDAFVMFSSASATWGSGWQPGYAAANAYLDALAEHRRARGLAATSVAWGLWGGGGMSAGEAGEQVLKRGLRFMDPRLAVQALGQALDGAEDTLTVADVDWSRFAPTFTVWRPSPLISDLPEVRQALAEDGGDAVADRDAADGLAARLAGLPRPEQDRILTNLVRSEAAAVLGFPSADGLAADRPFRDLGFDSLIAVELRNRLNAGTGLRLPATLVFDYPTPAALAEYIRAEGFADADAPAPVLDEIDRLEAALAGADPDPATRSLVAERLRIVLAAWSREDEAGRTAGETAGRRIADATDDEIFDFIHNELGRS
ncbi:SDR family NAD(P)-dependent oxidoreductase [Catenulispora sp. NL8]|uniref:SDR family NAD(P)-dependent oxidoreductase n=1 Tax=Catenulispora pinistramenti TaxID=2705254 RepID=A0ABS5KJQ6_9ACTN|nr:type I polyketide synthase [Catenulispora pinistramenti]MBS2545271.1 SDR family NAD(P)-dependent oxidoreductase [Catenulispora pinistramenti]